MSGDTDGGRQPGRYAEGITTGKTTRRAFLATGVAFPVAGIAGCLGSGSDTQTTATPATSGDTQTTASGGTSEESLQAWRDEVRAAAREELEDEKLQVWARRGEYRVMPQLLNGEAPNQSPVFDEDDGPIIEEGSPWEPLKDSVQVTQVSPDKQRTRYRRQRQTGTVKVDVLTGDLAQLVKQDVPLMDLASIPTWQRTVPDRLQEQSPKMGYYAGSVVSIAYNKRTLDEPPRNLLDLLDSRFKGRIMIDVTPEEFVPWLFLERHEDTVPPRLKALGSNMTGSEFVDALVDQNPVFTDSQFTKSQKVGQGEVDVGFFMPYGLIASSQLDGLPIEPMSHPSGHIVSARRVGAAKNPPHPAATKLLIDYVLSHQEVQLAFYDSLPLDLSTTSAKDLTQYAAADWQRTHTVLEIDNLSEIDTMWKEELGAPTL